MYLSKFRSHHPRWSRFLGITRIQDSEKTRHRALNLMSLASVAMFASLLMLLVMLSYVFLGPHHSPPESKLFFKLFTLSNTSLVSHVSPVQIIGVAVLALVAVLAPLIALRRLAKALYQGPLVSTVVAHRFDQLAKSLILGFLISFLLKLWPGIPMSYTSIGTGFFGFLWIFIAVSLCHTVASIIHAGVQAAEENRGFV